MKIIGLTCGVKPECLLVGRGTVPFPANPSPQKLVKIVRELVEKGKTSRQPGDAVCYSWLVFPAEEEAQIGLLASGKYPALPDRILRWMDTEVLSRVRSRCGMKHTPTVLYFPYYEEREEKLDEMANQLALAFEF